MAEFGVLPKYYAQIRPESRESFNARVDPDLFFSLDLSRWPMSLRVKINAEKLSRNVGNRLATKIKQRLRQGLRANGAAIPAPVTGGQPLNVTGELIKSIRYKDGWVAASWHRKRQEKLARKSQWRMVKDRNTGRMRKSFMTTSVTSNFGLMIVLQSTGGTYTRRHTHGRKRDGSLVMRRPPMDLMGADSPETRKVIEALCRKELQRQLDAGEAGLAAELRSIAARNKRLAEAAARRGG